MVCACSPSMHSDLARSTWLNKLSTKVSSGQSFVASRTLRLRVQPMCTTAVGCIGKVGRHDLRLGAAKPFRDDLYQAEKIEVVAMVVEYEFAAMKINASAFAEARLGNQSQSQGPDGPADSV